ncbi:protein CUSTOS [Pseudophryne corroboree]|uniref:protein CUSTOS n=1 Tax=Pseudophryne corroboree TaxID=495146 RepID=UPI003081B194
MAAPRSSQQGSRDAEDSSSGEEELERFREAAWQPPGIDKSVRCLQNPISPVIPSLRVRPDCHEHDGNELETTPEFRTHVARKLSAILDRCIKEIPGSGNLKQDPKATSNSEDEGFRLFRTSVPGDCGTVISSSISKRRVASSTSEDSEEEKQRRFCEAAVSGLDILKQSALQPIPGKNLDTVCNNQLKKKCKKKKKKKDKGLGDDIVSDEQDLTTESGKNATKRKKKKVVLENNDELSDR